jgi:hypothetical protein
MSVVTEDSDVTICIHFSQPLLSPFKS